MTDREILRDLVEAMLAVALPVARRVGALELALRRNGGLKPGELEKAENYLRGFGRDDLTVFTFRLQQAREELRGGDLDRHE